MQTKFKSGMNLFLVISLAAYQIVMILLLTSPIFADTKSGLYFGLFFLGIDAVWLLPMPFLTVYEVRETELYIRDWPFRVYKIPYGSIISIEDGDFEAKHKKIVALSMNRIAVGYKKEVHHRKRTPETIEEYIYISPDNMQAFLLRISGKMQIGEMQAQEQAKALAEKNAAHLEKKKAAQLARKRKKEAQKPEIIEANGLVRSDETAFQQDTTDKTK